MTDPRTPAEWQNAVDAAELLLTIHSAQAYGLIEGGPIVNTDRCEDILRRGAVEGIRPSDSREFLNRKEAR